VLMMPAGKTPDAFTRALWQSYQQRRLGASRRNGRRSENFAYQYLKYLKRSLTCRKILRRGTSGFTSHPNEGVLRIFIAIKNSSPRPGLNPRPLGPVASTPTTTPPRRLQSILSFILIIFTYVVAAATTTTIVPHSVKLATTECNCNRGK
jgi:hypothetical protein